MNLKIQDVGGFLDGGQERMDADVILKMLHVDTLQQYSL